MDHETEKKSVQPGVQMPSPVIPPAPSGLVTMSFDALPKLGNPFQPLIWVDAMQCLLRGNAAGATIRFFSMMPEAAIEVVRIQMSEETIKHAIDNLTNMLNYYPKPPESGVKP